ncbi:ExeM/NucH family extracellular endonuclease [Corynebacterium minutissimum]|uniref:ExeM/NucH family extracellular endonuclease n=1 Tax=Corynebacterium minutissimum TaxID=38301 RepID=UPI001EF371C0|nr:ExeM/NucH family extracellular endonuclease [Corynebacterium minutissimum]MCG7238852.1 ExeM/NucH family extracellular endonuclease [Corynebacterium minutissimum]
MEYFSSKGNSGGKTTLNGSIPAGGYYLIQEGGGGTGEPLPTPDAEGGLSMSGSKGSVKLYDASGAEVDVVGYGEASISEGAPTPALSSTTSAQRNAAGNDTDDNAADFSTAAPTPKSGGGATAPEDPQPEDPRPAEPGSTVTIPDIQGTGAESPLKGQTVTTQGVVTAVWKGEKSLNGFTIQTPGTGETAPAEASEAVFVYTGGTGFYPSIGESVEVTGSVDEYYGQTQIALSTGSVLTDALPAVTSLSLEALPEGDEAREKLESMLLKPGVHTVTDNYGLNRYGELGLAPGTEALRQPTDKFAPGSAEMHALEESNAAKYVILDDGSTRDFTRDGASTKLPYIMQNGSEVKTIRTTNQVEFADSGVILGYGHNQWRFQPTSMITGDSATADLPITWDPARPEAPQVEGDYTVAAFNVLNFFINLGEDNGAKAYKDRFGNGVGSDSGTFRGAWSKSAFNDQKGKILTALEGLDADVIGLSEIENAANTVGGSYDDAVKYLVGELNTRAGSEKWDYVKAPANAAADTDVIRTAIIYKKDRVEPVGEATLLEDERFKGTARTPLAAEFKPVADKCAPKGPDSFVAVTNHFKSKGSVANGDKDTGDGQGNNPNVRNAHAQAVLDGLSKQPKWQKKATFVMGDLNAYSKEDAISIFRNAGYTIPVEELNPESEWQAVASYQFSGRIGSLDHILANEHVDAKAAQTWNINSDEPIAMEYSRRNYTGGDVFEADNPYRSSDHDPVKVGFNLAQVSRSEDELKDCDPSEDPTPSDDARSIKSVTINDEGHLIITYTDGTTEDAGKVVGADGKDGKDGDKGDAGQDGKDGTDGKDGRGIKSVATNDKGELIITYTDGTTENAGKVIGADGKDGDKGDAGQDGKDGTDGKDGADGKDGRGIKSVTTNDEGDLIITYTDGTTENAGKVSGPKGDKGEPGKDGRGIESVRINDKGELIVTFTDGEEQNVGKVVGSDGKDGQDGADGNAGDKGDAGQDGKDGADGKDGRGIKSVTTNDKGEVVVTYTDGTSEILGTLAGAKGDQGAPGRDGFDGAPGRDGTDGRDGANGKDGKDGKDGRGIKSVTTDADGNLVITYTDGTSETVKSGDKPAAPAGGSSVSERCLPTVLGLTIPAALAIPLAFLGSFGAKLNIPGLEPVKKQIESITRNFPREAQYAAGGIGLLAALGIIAAACAPTESE